MTRVLASAVVDQLRFGKPGVFEVRVWGGEKPAENEDLADHRRVYTVEAQSDNMAAQEGLRRFTEEIEALCEWK